MGYPKDLLSTRAVVKPGLWAVIPKEGLVNNVVPEIEGCKVSIVASPKMGAGFVQYIIDAGKGGGTKGLFGTEPDIETFIYIVDGEVDITVEGKTYAMKNGGYAFAPAGTGLGFQAVSFQAKILLYKQVFIPYKDLKPYVVTGNIEEVPFRIYDEMSNVHIKDFLPVDDVAFDMNMHILSFEPGRSEERRVGKEC